MHAWCVHCLQEVYPSRPSSRPRVRMLRMTPLMFSLLGKPIVAWVSGAVVLASRVQMRGANQHAPVT